LGTAELKEKSNEKHGGGEEIEGVLRGLAGPEKSHVSKGTLLVISREKELQGKEQKRPQKRCERPEKLSFFISAGRHGEMVTGKAKAYALPTKTKGPFLREILKESLDGSSH